MSFVKIEPFSKIVLAKYKTGDCLINSTIKPKKIIGIFNTDCVSSL